MEVDPSRADEVQLPSDEWGAVAPLLEAYRGFVRTYWPDSEVVNVGEIGAGGGRSTAALLDVLGPQAGDYHVVDVSPVFVEVLRSRIERPLTIHVVDDVDLSALPSEHFDLCLAQSSWSHNNLYDQYRYLRDLRRVLRPGGVVFVNGHFLLGTGDDWTWNRFCTRVRRIDESTVGAPGPGRVAWSRWRNERRSRVRFKRSLSRESSVGLRDQICAGRDDSDPP